MPARVITRVPGRAAGRTSRRCASAVHSTAACRLPQSGPRMVAPPRLATRRRAAVADSLQGNPAPVPTPGQAGSLPLLHRRCTQPEASPRRRTPAAGLPGGRVPGRAALGVAEPPSRTSGYECGPPPTSGYECGPPPHKRLRVRPAAAQAATIAGLPLLHRRRTQPEASPRRRTLAAGLPGSASAVPQQQGRPCSRAPGSPPT